jgi:hypothetical protein
VLDTGELAAEFGHVGGVYLAHHIPSDQLPRGKKAAALWVEGFSAIFGVIHEIFKAGDIPCTPTLLEALRKLPKKKLKLVQAYEKPGTEIGSALEALVQGAKEEWKGEFADTHCDADWDALPVCAKHDFDWILAADMLAE